MKKYHIIDSMTFTSEVNRDKIPNSYFKEDGSLNDYGRAILKNAMLARAYLKLSSRIENKDYHFYAIIGESYISIKHDVVKNLSVITLIVDVVEESNNHGEDKTN